MGLFDMMGISPQAISYIYFGLIMFFLFFFFICVPFLILIWLLRYKIKSVIIRERAGQALKGFRTKGYIKRKKGQIPKLKLRKIDNELPLPPKEAMVSLGRKDFVMFYEDNAGDLKPFKFFTDKTKLKKIIERVFDKANSRLEAMSLLVNYLIPSLSVDDVDMRNFKVMTDRETEDIYKKVSKWQTIAGIAILGLVIIAGIMGMIMMKTICK